jgi:hypothetical protein
MEVNDGKFSPSYRWVMQRLDIQPLDFRTILCYAYAYDRNSKPPLQYLGNSPQRTSIYQSKSTTYSHHPLP